MASITNKKTLQELIMMKNEIEDEVKKFQEKLKEAKRKQSEISEIIQMKEILEKGEAYKNYAIEYSLLNVSVDNVLQEVLNSLKSGNPIEIGDKIKIEATDKEVVLGEPNSMESDYET